MKYILLFILLFALSSFAQRADDVPLYQLTLKVENISNDDGVISVALCDSKKNYDEGDLPYKGLRGEIKNGLCIILFSDIPAGNYAIKLFHDENNNHKLDMNFMGIPSEDYGFSNDASGTFGPASWEDAMFEVTENKVVTINLD
ncbi:MAG: hypothetical protein SCALA702_15010 [Melioribacteraceae bacterium]|nr:MAG: hypothetical protein SCALA702_15010 [Melioribacteraceae bacterium]